MSESGRQLRVCRGLEVRTLIRGAGIPSTKVADGMLGIRLVSILMIAIVGMGVAPVPVLRLLPPIGL